MKIYAAENDNYIGYVLVGDHDKEYCVGGFRKDDSREGLTQGIERGLFFVLANKPLHANESPSFYIMKSSRAHYNITTDDDLQEFKKEVNKSLHVKKFIKDTNLYYTCPVLESYSERDKYFLMCADLQAKFQHQRDNLNAMTMKKGNSR